MKQHRHPCRTVCEVERSSGDRSRPPPALSAAGAARPTPALLPSSRSPFLRPNPPTGTTPPPRPGNPDLPRPAPVPGGSLRRPPLSVLRPGAALSTPTLQPRGEGGREGRAQASAADPRFPAESCCWAGPTATSPKGVPEARRDFCSRLKHPTAPGWGLSPPRLRPRRNNARCEQGCFRNPAPPARSCA